MIPRRLVILAALGGFALLSGCSSVRNAAAAAPAAVLLRISRLRMYRTPRWFFYGRDDKRGKDGRQGVIYNIKN